MKLRYLLPTLENPFWQTVALGMREAAIDADALLQVTSANDDEFHQATELMALADHPPDVVILSPCGMTNVRPALEALAEAKVPVIAVDQNLGIDVRASVISGNTGGGVSLATFVAKRLPKGAHLLHLEAQRDLQSVVLRRRAFFRRLERDSEYEQVTRNAGGSRRRASIQIQEHLDAGGRIDALFAENDVMALGAIDVLSERGLDPWPLVVGFDAIAEAKDAIRSGRMAATVAQQPELMGRKAAELAVAIARGETVEPVITVLTKLITADDVDGRDPA